MEREERTTTEGREREGDWRGKRERGDEEKDIQNAIQEIKPAKIRRKQIISSKRRSRTLRGEGDTERDKEKKKNPQK